jgi:catechol 2,3-dioxygenase-like lactoylglutathione lyase family enzyme
MPSLARVTELRVKLYVSDFSARRAFYETVLQWPVLRTWDGAEHQGVMFDTGSGIFELLEETGASPHNHSVDLSLQTENVWKLWDLFKNQNNVVFPLRDNPWGDTSFCIHDPGGFHLTFFSQTQAG